MCVTKWAVWSVWEEQSLCRSTERTTMVQSQYKKKKENIWASPPSIYSNCMSRGIHFLTKSIQLYYNRWWNARCSHFPGCMTLSQSYSSHIASSIAVQVYSAVTSVHAWPASVSVAIYNNSVFCCSLLFCYLLMWCILRSKPGHKHPNTHTQPEHVLGYYSPCPLLLWYTLFYSTDSKICSFLLTFQQ